MGNIWHFPSNLYIFCLLQWFSATDKKCVHCSDSVRQKKFFLSEWLSGTNKSNLCHSDSVQKQYWSKYPISLWHVTKEMKKPQKQTFFQIGISPPLSNCFGVPYWLNVYLRKESILNINMPLLAMLPNHGSLDHVQVCTNLLFHLNNSYPCVLHASPLKTGRVGPVDNRPSTKKLHHFVKFFCCIFFLHKKNC